MLNLWQKLLPGVSDTVIAKLIYNDGYTPEQIKHLRVHHSLKPHLTADDKALMKYVQVMRAVNNEMDRLADPWFYPYPGDSVMTRLDSLARVCVSRLRSKHGDRYAVIAGRALLALKQFDVLDSIAKRHRFADPEMRHLFRPLFAGALYRRGRYSEALDVYAREGDMTSVRWCLEKLGRDHSTLDALLEMSRNPSNYNIVCGELQTLFRSYEKAAYYYPTSDISRSSLARDIEKVRQGSKIHNACRPLWQYTEAFLHMLNGSNYTHADSVLAHINMQTIESNLATSVKTLRFISQSALRPYNHGYLEWLAKEAAAMIELGDRQRHAEIDMLNSTRHNRRVLAADIVFRRNTHESLLYGTDMLHKATDCIILPKMLQHGDTVSALRLLDIVDHANLTDAIIACI